MELAAGIHWFLKRRCGSSVSWHLTGGSTLDTSCLAADALQRLAQEPPLRRERSVPYSYYQNVVTPRSVITLFIGCWCTTADAGVHNGWICNIAETCKSRACLESHDDGLIG